VRISREERSREELEALVLKAQGGDLEARNEVIIQYMPLVIYQATKRRLAGAIPSWIETDDLEQIGTFAIIHAIKKFRTNGGCHFGGYLFYWLKSYFCAAILRQKMYCVPSGTLASRKQQPSGTLAKKRSPKYKRKNTIDATNWAIENFKEMILFTDVESGIPTPYAPDSHIGHYDLKDFFAVSFKKLSEMEQLIVIEWIKGVSLKEISVMVHHSRECVSKIKNEALQKLREMFEEIKECEPEPELDEVLAA